jgi:hypothetical protein
VLAAIIELHKEGFELSSKNIADKVNESDESLPITSEKVGWLTRRLGFRKDKDGSTRRRVICWEQDRVERLAKQYGLTIDRAVSTVKPFTPFEPYGLRSHSAKGSGGLEQSEAKPFGVVDEKPFGTSQNEAKGFQKTEKPFEKPFEPEPMPETKGLKGSKGFQKDTEEKIGMTVSDAIAIWKKAGSPVIHLGTGESCVDLEILLDNRRINGRHLSVIRGWLEEKRQR